MNAKQSKTLIIGSIIAAIIGAASGWINSTLVSQGQQIAERVQHGESKESAINDQVRKMDDANLRAVTWFANGLNGLGQTLEMATKSIHPQAKSNQQE